MTDPALTAPENFLPGIEPDIYRRVIDFHGAQKQKEKAVEELAELAVEVMKDVNGKGSVAKIIEELADVENICAELRMIYDADNLCDYWKHVKMKRILKRMEKQKKEATA